jgi:hypothetical protein
MKVCNMSQREEEKEWIVKFLSALFHIVSVFIITGIFVLSKNNQALSTTLIFSIFFIELIFLTIITVVSHLSDWLFKQVSEQISIQHETDRVALKNLYDSARKEEDYRYDIDLADQQVALKRKQATEHAALVEKRKVMFLQNRPMLIAAVHPISIIFFFGVKILLGYILAQAF